MKKKLLLGMGAVLAATTVSAQTTVPVQITSGYNADVVVEALPAADHLTLGVDNNQTGFLVNGVVYEENGLPAMPATSNNGNVYDIDYTGNNALSLKSGDGASGTLVFVEPISTNQIWVLGISANGTSKLNVVVNYEDGSSSDPVELTYGDWWNSSTDNEYEGFSLLDRIMPSNGYPDGTDKVHLDEYAVTADANKEAVSVTITRVSGGLPSILGLSAGNAAIAIASGLTDDIVAEDPDNLQGSVTTGIDDPGYVLYAKGAGIGNITIANSLPVDGQITTAAGTTYAIDYTALNAARLGEGSRTITLGVGGEPKYEKLYFLGTAASGPQTISVQITYTDQTTSTGSFQYKDWYKDNAEGDEALYGLMRTVSYTDNGLDTRANFRLFEGEVEANPRKAIASIQLTATGGTPVVMGVSAIEASASSGVVVYSPIFAYGWNADIFAEEKKDSYSEKWLDNQGWAFYTKSFQVDGAVAGMNNLVTTVGGHKYMLMDYDVDNALVLNANGNSSIAAQSEGTLFIEDGSLKADAITFLGMTGDGAGSVAAKVNYSDGTSSDEVTFNFGDWCSGSDHAIDGTIRRMYVGADNPGYVDNYWNISTSECTIPTDNTKTIASVTFTQKSAIPVIFALGRKVTVYDIVDESDAEGPQTAHKITGKFNADEFVVLDRAAMATAYDLTEVTDIPEGASLGTLWPNSFRIVTEEQKAKLSNKQNVLVHEDGLVYNADQIILRDGSGDLFLNNGQDIIIKAQNSAYYRYGFQGNFGTIVLPIPAALPDGFKAYELTGTFDGNAEAYYLKFEEHAGELSVSRPYVVKNEAAATAVPNIAIVNTEEKELRISENFTLGVEGYTMKPSYQTITTRAADGRYTIQPGNTDERPSFKVCDGEIGAFRAYLEVSSDVLGSAKQIFIEFSDATGIRRATAEEISELFNVYSIDGRLVKGKTQSVVGLPQGIYVINGKKVVVK